MSQTAKTPTTRYIIAGIMYLVGFPLCYWSSLHLDYSDNMFIPLLIGLILIISAGFLLRFSIPEASNIPTERDEENWRTVPKSSYERISAAVKRAKGQFFNVKGIGCSGGCALFVVIFFMVLIGLVTLDINYDFGNISWTVFLFCLLLIPFTSQTKPNVFIPELLDFKMATFDQFLKDIEKLASPNVTALPQIRFDRDEEGKDIPEDVKLTFTVKNAPADFVTAQLVISKTEVKDQSYNFLYSVFVLKNGLTSAARTIIEEHLTNSLRYMELEYNNNQDYQIFVYKLASGYETDDKQMKAILKTTLNTLEALANHN